MIDENILKESSGKSGFSYVTGTKTGNFAYLVVDTALAEFSAVGDQCDDLPSVARSEGIIIAGSFSSVTVTSGAVRAYNAVK